MTSEKDDVHISDEATIIWYQAILNRYNSANSANSTIDTKSGVILAASVAALIYIAQTAAAPRIFSILAAVGLLVTIIIGIKSIHVKDTSTEVHTATEQESYYSKSDTEFYWQLLADLQESLKNIDVINKTKGRLYRWMVYTFLTSSLCVVLAPYIKLTVTLGWE